MQASIFDECPKAAYSGRVATGRACGVNVKMGG